MEGTAFSVEVAITVTGSETVAVVVACPSVPGFGDITKKDPTVQLSKIMPSMEVYSTVAEETYPEDAPTQASLICWTLPLPLQLAPQNITSSDMAMQFSSSDNLGQRIKASRGLHDTAEAFTLNSTVLQLVPVGALRHSPLLPDNL